MKLSIGTPLIHLMDYIENRRMPDEFKEKILTYCRTELKIGDGKITNEIELAILNAWLSGTNEIVMPKICEKCKLIYSTSYEEGPNIKSLEEYIHEDNTYYVKLSTINKEGKVIKTQLTHRTKSLEDLMKHGGTEDILIDSNGENIADSRLINKTGYNEDGVKEHSIHYDINIDGELD
ncbi:MAG: hypothetical protein IKU37_07190 [Candidatus Gastranaerophilales bacterium]|nr:hypothetical protein [Candidatus Gastranaerophilales bacterium]